MFICQKHSYFVAKNVEILLEGFVLMRIIDRSENKLSPYVSLVTRKIVIDSSAAPSFYHSLKPRDYVCILPLTSDGNIIMVRQYRPILERTTLELPAGLLDDGLDPIVGARRELIEETGWDSDQPLSTLGKLDPDTGRLENRLWCYLASCNEKLADWQPETGVEPVIMSPVELQKSVNCGEFNHALHLAVLMLAVSLKVFNIY